MLLDLRYELADDVEGRRRGDDETSRGRVRVDGNCTRGRTGLSTRGAGRVVDDAATREGVLVDVLLALDPGTKHPALAVFVDGRLDRILTGD